MTAEGSGMAVKGWKQLFEGNKYLERRQHEFNL